MFDTNILKNQFNVLDGLKTHKLSFQTVWPISGYVAFCGAQGSGKSLSVNKLIADCKKKWPALTIVSNVPLSFCEYIPYSFQTMLDLDALEVKGIILYLDEISTNFSNLDKVDPKLSYILDMMRKRELCLISTNPQYPRINKAIREKIDTLVLCKNYFKVFQVNNYYRCKSDVMAVCDNTQDLVNNLHREKRHFFFHSLEDYNRYDTTKIVELDKEVVK